MKVKQKLENKDQLESSQKKNEKKIFWKLSYDLQSPTPVYSNRQVERNIFITEREYKKLVASSPDPHLYQVLSVLWQVACKIKLCMWSCGTPLV